MSWTTLLALVGFGLIHLIGTPRELRALQLPEEDQVRLAAFEYLTTTLFPIDTASTLPHCFSLRDETAFDALPEGPGRDPSPPLMNGIRRFIPDASMVSECPDPDRGGGAAGASSPVIYSVGALTQAGSAIRVPLSYIVNGHGGGWACSAALRSGVWRLIDCLPTWISAPD